MKEQTREREDLRVSSSEKRLDRVPFGAERARLSVTDIGGKLEGYQLRWFNDDGDRILRALNAGYQFVGKNHVLVGSNRDGNFDLGSYVSQPVGVKATGQPMLAYLMAIPKELYMEDQEAKLKSVEEIDEAINRGAIGQKADDGRYLQYAHIEINGRL